MPHEPILITRTELALLGRDLRAAARYLLRRPPGFGWEVAAGLVRAADRIDPSHRDHPMSDFADKVNPILDRFDADAATIAQLTTDKAALQAQVDASPVKDDADRAALDRIAAEAAKLSPPPPPQPAPEVAPAQ